MWRTGLRLLTPAQNKAYAVSQLADLHQKLSKAQTAVAGTRAMAPVIKGADHKVWWLNRVQCSYTY